MKATATWKQDMTFIGAADSGFPVQMDAGKSVGGTNNGVRPMELLALGLAGCAAMDVISILKKKRQNITQFDVRVELSRAEEFPKVFTSAVIAFSVGGRGVDEAAVLRAIELSATKYCPAEFMFSQLFPIDMQYEIYEIEEQGDKRLVHQGVWQEAPTE
jgi:putative redox protein